MNIKYPNIEAERIRNGMTKDEFAGKLGVKRRTLYNWLNNDKIPKQKVVEMSTLFHCSIDYLLYVND